MSMKSCAAAVGAACALAAVPATASADSLVYVKDGNVFLSGQDGSRAQAITTDGGYESPSQADDGTIVAGRQTEENGRHPRRLYRMDRTGRLLNAPVETVATDNSYYIGPLQPKVSPHGRSVAYHYLDTGPIEDDTEPVLAWSYSDRDTVNGELGANKGYLNPSWTQDGRTLAFYAAERTFQVDVQSVNGPVDNWFGDNDVSPLLLDGELSRDGTRLAAIGNGAIRLYDVPAGPLNPPVLRCEITGFNGDPLGPTWSSDGRTLAWQETDGIHSMPLDDLDACASASRALVVARGADPDFGPVDLPAAGGDGGGGGGGGGGGALSVTLGSVRKTVKLATLRRGLPVRVTCAVDCKLSAKLKVRGRDVASGSGRGAAGRVATVRVEGRSARAGRGTLTVTARGADGSKATIKRKLTLKR